MLQGSPLTRSKQWQARETEEDLAAITAKAARAWEKQCRKYVRQSKGGRLGGEKKPGKFAILVARVRPQKPGKGKKKEGQPEEQPSEKNGKAAALKQRLAAIKDKRSKTKEGQPEEQPSEKNGKTAALKQRLAAIKDKRSKKKEGQPEAQPSEKNGKAAALKQRLAAIKDKRNNKKQQNEETDPTEEKQSKKEKAQKAAGIILFPVIVILGIPILIGKGIASGFKKVRDRKKKTDGDAEAEGTEQQPQQAKTSRRAAMKHRLSERSGSVKQGLSTRSEAFKNRLAERKAKKAGADGATTPAAAASRDDQTDAAAGEGAAVGEDTAAQPRLNKKQRLTSLLAAGPLAVNHMIKNRRGGGRDQTTTTTPEDATAKDKKASRFAGLKERVKASRTKVNKQARFAKIRARLRALQERRQNRKNVKKNATDNNTGLETEVDDSNNTSNVKRHGAIAGLAAACVALPAAKMKQVRDKRRKDKAADGVEGAAAAAREEHVTANNSSVAAPATATAAEEQGSASPASRPSGVRLVPSEPEMLEPAVDQFRPPENGQSEVPVQQAARTEPDSLPDSSAGGVDSAAAAAEADEDHAVRPAAAVRFKSIRDGFGNVKGGIGSGITNLKARRRGTEQSEVPVTEEAPRPQAETMDSAETHVEASPSNVEPTTQSTPAHQETAASGGRFKSIKDGIGSGIEGLKAKRQREKEAPSHGGETAATAATEDEKKTAAAANKNTASPGARLKALKDGIGGRKAKTAEDGPDAPIKTEKSKQHKQQTHKDSNSGLVDRMRWFLYAA